MERGQNRIRVERSEPAAADRYEADRYEDDYRRWQVEMPRAYNLDEDRVRWGPVWAGLVTAFSVSILMTILGLAVGLAVVSPGDLAGGVSSGVALAAAIWSALTGIVAFFLGGFVAGRMAAVFSRRWGAWNGAMVFLLALPLSLLLGAFGTGAFLGVFGQLAATAGTLFNLNLQQGLGGAPNVLPAQALNTLTSTAWWTLIGALVALGAAAIGGAAGTRRHIALERMAGEVEPQDEHEEHEPSEQRRTA